MCDQEKTNVGQTLYNIYGELTLLERISSNEHQKKSINKMKNLITTFQLQEALPIDIPNWGQKIADRRRITDLSKILSKVMDLESKINQNESYRKKEELIKATESLEILSGSFNPTISPISHGISKLNYELEKPREYMKMIKEILDLIVELSEGAIAYGYGTTDIYTDESKRPVKISNDDAKLCSMYGAIPKPEKLADLEKKIRK